MRMDICLSSDDNYAKYMATTMASILLNSNEDEEIYFHLIDGGITEENKNKLLSLKKIKNCEIMFYTPDIEKYNKWYTWGGGTNYKGRFSPAMFYRLNIHLLIPHNIDRILYLDCDTIVLKSLKEMFTINFDNKYAIVSDNNNDQSYFNSGVIMVNARKWRETNIENEFDNNFYNSNGRVWGDESILNTCLKNKVKFVDKSYNYIANKIEESKLKIPYNDINIIHYISLKPWTSNIKSAILIDEFWKYYQLTPWFLERPIDAIQTILAQKYSDYEDTKLKINDIKCFGICLLYTSDAADE